MNVLIVDDEPLSRNELAYLLQQNPAIADIFQADGTANALQLLVKKKIDLLFLDIELNEENGFSLAEELKGLVHPPLVVFATAYDQYAVDAFDVNAIDYILKHFEQKRVDQAVAKATMILDGKLQKSQEPVVHVLTITQDEKTSVLKTSQIIDAIVDNGELTIATAQQKIKTHETLSWFKQRLTEAAFMQVHRNAIANLDQIKEIQPWFNHTYQLTMSNGDKIPVGRAFIKELRERLHM